MLCSPFGQNSVWPLNGCWPVRLWCRVQDYMLHTEERRSLDWDRWHVSRVNKPPRVRDITFSEPRSCAWAVGAGLRFLFWRSHRWKYGFFVYLFTFTAKQTSLPEDSFLNSYYTRRTLSLSINRLRLVYPHLFTFSTSGQACAECATPPRPGHCGRFPTFLVRSILRRKTGRSAFKCGS